MKIYDIFHAKLNAVESLQTLAQDLFHNCKKRHIISQTTGRQTAKVDLQWLLPFMKTRCLKHVLVLMCKIYFKII